MLAGRRPLRLLRGVWSGALVGAGPVVAVPETKVELSLYAVNGGQVQPGVAVQDVGDRRSGDSDSLRRFGEGSDSGRRRRRGNSLAMCWASRASGGASSARGPSGQVPPWARWQRGWVLTPLRRGIGGDANRGARSALSHPPPSVFL